MKVYLTLLSVVLISSVVFAQPWGEIIGRTYYAYQNNGSAGNRIALGDDGNIYVCWMNALVSPPPPRHVYYNWRDVNGNWAFDCGCQVDDRPDFYASAGFPTMALYQGYRVAITYHYTTPQYVARLAVDNEDFPGYCYFERYNVPNLIGSSTFIWPHIAVDYNNNTHIVMTELMAEPGEDRIIYTRSNDGGLNWIEPVIVDTNTIISVTVVSSPVSNRVAICYVRDNVFYIVSEDGQNWDWENGIIPIIHYDTTQRIGCELDPIFDYNEILHLTWPTVDTISGDSWLWHYDEVLDTITPIANNPDYTSPPWQLSISQVSLSRCENSLFAVWTQFSDEDISSEGIPNGDLFMSRSFDMGLTWEEPLNITNSHSPNCFPGDCTSEIYSNAAEDTDSLPHITYIFDSGEPEALVMYLGPDHIVGLEDKEVTIPDQFKLYQNYPNPFNVSTTIRYDLPEPSDVTINIYDILGRKVETLFSERQEHGSHSLIWQADEFKSGIYFYKLTACDFSQTKKMILLR